MKTQQEIETLLKESAIEYKELEKNNDVWDMNRINFLFFQIKLLRWVLNIPEEKTDV